MKRLVSVAFAAVACAAPANASDGPPALCTDRPAKATSACTVPKGMVQFESDLLNFTRQTADGVATDTILYTSPEIKYGLGDSTDVEVAITPYETIRVHGGGGGTSIGGVGDLYLRVKQRLTDADAKTQLALIPFVKLPTAKVGIGNGKVEGGLVGTAQFSLPANLSLTVTPEIDALENGDLDGSHVQLAGAINLGRTLTSTLSTSVELWSAQNYDPGGTVRQYSLDGAFAWLAGPTLQFDVGANLGLNRATPGLQTYAGVSTRF